MYPVLFSIGPLTVYSFGLLVAVGFYVGCLAAAGEYARRGFDSDKMWNLCVWLFVGGLAAARLVSVTNDWQGFVENPVAALFSAGGFVWYGGLAGGVATAALLARRYKIRLPVLAECAALGLPIGQAIGRLGCHISGDGDWGVVTDLPWGVAYTNAIVGWPHAAGVLVHPTPIYEALCYGAVFLLLLGLRRRNPPEGTLFCLYLAGTSLSRFLVEFLRVNPEAAFGLTQAQLVAVVLFGGSSLWLVRRGVASFGVALLVAFVLALPACQTTGLAIGERAPDFVLPRLDGSVQRLANYRGRPVLINHWATWCPPCIEEVPVLNDIAREFGPRGLAVLALAADEDSRAVADFIAKTPVAFDILLDASGEIGTKYGITGYPETFLVDRDGRIRGRVIGPIPSVAGRPDERFREKIKALLGG
ncbi:MAG: prolipoprotein diacylglyceryl transferase family protein [Deltaproteobacteria bacterium]